MIEVFVPLFFCVFDPLKKTFDNSTTEEYIRSLRKDTRILYSIVMVRLQKGYLETDQSHQRRLHMIEKIVPGDCQLLQQFMKIPW